MRQSPSWHEIDIRCSTFPRALSARRRTVAWPRGLNDPELLDNCRGSPKRRPLSGSFGLPIWYVVRAESMTSATDALEELLSRRSENSERRNRSELGVEDSTYSNKRTTATSGRSEQETPPPPAFAAPVTTISIPPTKRLRQKSKRNKILVFIGHFPN